MKTIKFIIHVLISIVLLSCQKTSKNSIEKNLKNSNFDVEKDYKIFSEKMKDNDTLNIGVVLSLCMHREYDKLQITKSNNKIFLQVIEKTKSDEEQIKFPKVLYDLKEDSLNLEKMMNSFNLSNQDSSNSRFFIIESPNKNKPIILRTTGRGDRIEKIINYSKIMFNLYSNENNKYKQEYKLRDTAPPPTPPAEDSV
jgi:hypothetical protein